ncbi:hypothetical protein ACNF49_28880 [Actinomadura sp. ATCC 39365]
MMTAAASAAVAAQTYGASHTYVISAGVPALCMAKPRRSASDPPGTAGAGWRGPEGSGHLIGPDGHAIAGAQSVVNLDRTQAAAVQPGPGGGVPATGESAPQGDGGSESAAGRVAGF